ncbi:MAG: RNA polymerase sigma factor [Planctomycetota bacterium]|jgi:RNA polymerase sigma-70 factor (ECF subfamily)
MLAVAPAPLTWSQFEFHRNSLEKFLTRRCRDSHEVEDVVQESFLRAAASSRGLRDQERLRGWLLRIASNVLADRARSEGRRRRMLETMVAETPPDARHSPAPEAALEESEWWIEGHPFSWATLSAALVRSLESLRPGDRRVLLEHYVRGASCKRSAEREGTTADALKVRLFRARQRLRQAIVDELFEGEEWSVAR